MTMNQDQARRWAEKVLSDDIFMAVLSAIGESHYNAAPQYAVSGSKVRPLMIEAIAAALVKLTQGQEPVTWERVPDPDFADFKKWQQLPSDELYIYHRAPDMTWLRLKKPQGCYFPEAVRHIPSQQEDRKLLTDADAMLGAKIRKLCDGGTFDLTDSPHSMRDTVIRLCADTAAHNIKEQQ